MLFKKNTDIQYNFTKQYAKKIILFYTLIYYNLIAYSELISLK